MLTLVSSSIVFESVQEDGRRAVSEEHRFSNGAILNVDYTAEPNEDLSVRLADHGASLLSELIADDERSKAMAQKEVRRASALLSLPDSTLCDILGFENTVERIAEERFNLQRISDTPIA